MEKENKYKCENKSLNRTGYSTNVNIKFHALLMVFFLENREMNRANYIIAGLFPSLNKTCKTKPKKAAYFTNLQKVQRP